MIEFFGGANQAQRSFLNQILKGQAAIHVFFGDRDDQAQVGLHHLVLGAPSDRYPFAKLLVRHIGDFGPAAQFLFALGHVTGSEQVLFEQLLVGEQFDHLDAAGHLRRTHPGAQPLKAQ